MEDLIGKPGQINLDTNLGEIIYNLVAKSSFDVIIDVGTWNGLGTTTCILQALEDTKNTNTKVFTIELYADMFQVARKNLSKYLDNPNFKMLNGRLIDFEDVYWFDHKKETGKYTDPHAQAWYFSDMKYLSEAFDVSSHIPDKIDLLILDGGEYTTYPEWQKLKHKTDYFVLDDTNILKCAKIKEEVLYDPEYEIIHNVINERNGYLVGRKKRQ